MEYQDEGYNVAQADCATATAEIRHRLSRPQYGARHPQDLRRETWETKRHLRGIKSLDDLT